MHIFLFFPFNFSFTVPICVSLYTPQEDWCIISKLYTWMNLCIHCALDIKPNWSHLMFLSNSTFIDGYRYETTPLFNLLWGRKNFMVFFLQGDHLFQNNIHARMPTMQGDHLLQCKQLYLLHYLICKHFHFLSHLVTRQHFLQNIPNHGKKRRHSKDL